MEQQLQESPGVTVILTSCGRQDLLYLTLQSFIKFNTYDIADFWIYEDCGRPGINDELKTEYPFIKWIEPTERTGQIVALDTLWGKVTTSYAFTLEDDWKFTREGFIEASMEVLEKDPKIAQVWLRDYKEANQHPIVWNPDYGVMKSDGGLWAGIGFNPSLKRKADYDLIGSYGKHTTFVRHRPWKAEADISQLYNRLGFKAAILPDAYITHIGAGRHVN
jgi:hypothetical protein